MNDEEIDEFLEHFGIKGMHWGVHHRRAVEIAKADRNKKFEAATGHPAVTLRDKLAREFDTAGFKQGVKNLSPLERNVLKSARNQGMTEDRMKKMFGPPATKSSKTSTSSHFKLTDKDKEVLKNALVIGGAAAALYGLNRIGTNALLKQSLGEFKDSKKLNEFWRTYNRSAAKMAFSKKDVESLSTEGVHLKAGSIIKRISTEMETDIKPQGFYAAYKDEDVNRYKAVLPVFWKSWGRENLKGGGYVVKLKANTDIKAASPRQTYDHFVEFLDRPMRGGGKYRDLVDPNAFRKDLGLLPGRHKSTEELAREAFRPAAQRWNDPDDTLTKEFFKFVQAKGYNAVVDSNDAGHLADTPLRLLDGKMFEVAGHDRLTVKAIRAAQEQLVKVAHMISEQIDSFLAHVGVKGMHWGHHNKKPQSRAQIAERRKANRARTVKLAAGLAFVSLMLAAKPSNNRSLKPLSPDRYKKSMSLIIKNHAVKISSIDAAVRSGKASPNLAELAKGLAKNNLIDSMNKAAGIGKR